MRLQDLAIEAPQTSQESAKAPNKPSQSAADKSRTGHRRIRLHKHGLRDTDSHETRLSILPVGHS